MIGKHLINNYSLPKGNQKGKEIELFPICENLNTICAFTGYKISTGIKKDKVIKDVFTDYNFLKLILLDLYLSNYVI